MCSDDVACVKRTCIGDVLVGGAAMPRWATQPGMRLKQELSARVTRKYSNVFESSQGFFFES